MGGYDIPLPNPACSCTCRPHHPYLPNEASSSTTSAEPAYKQETNQRHVHRLRQAEDLEVPRGVLESVDHMPDWPPSPYSPTRSRSIASLMEEEVEHDHERTWSPSGPPSTEAGNDAPGPTRARSAASSGSSISSDTIRPPPESFKEFLSDIAKLIFYGSRLILLWPAYKILGLSSEERSCCTLREIQDNEQWTCHNQKCREVHKISNEKYCGQCGHYRYEPAKCKRCPKDSRGYGGESSRRG